MKTVDLVVENGIHVERLVIMPLEGQPALIMTPHERPVEGNVESSVGGRVELTVGFVPLDAERRWSRGLFIEYAVEVGVYRLHTRLLEIRRHDGAFRVSMETVDRAALLLTRQHVRAPLALPLRVKREDGWKRTVTVDIGGGGLRLPFELGLQIGEEVRMEIDSVPSHPIIVAGARVVREAPEGGFGLAFTDIRDEERAAIMALAFAHRRSQAREPAA